MYDFTGKLTNILIFFQLDIFSSKSDMGVYERKLEIHQFRFHVSDFNLGW